MESVRARRDEYYHQVRTGTVQFRLDDDDIVWRTTGNQENNKHRCTVQEGSFQSPLHDMLPNEAKDCHFHLVKPDDEGKRQPIYIIMLAATGEIGRKPRLAMAKQLAKKHGYTCLILSTAFYGRRKPANQKSFYPNTVSDLWRQYGAVIQEASVLAEYYLRNEPHCRVCFTGFSAGATHALCAAWICVVGFRLDGSRVGVASHATPASAAVFGLGCVRHMLDWEALRGHDREAMSTTRTVLQQELDLLSIEAAVTLRSSNDDEGMKHKLGSIQCTVFQQDLVSPRIKANVLSHLLPPLVVHPADCALDWLAGGHVHAYLIRPNWQSRLIVRAVAPLLQSNYSAPTAETV
jgi:hypothetical protein